MGFQQLGIFRGRSGVVTRDEFFRKPVVFYDKVTFEWADNRIVIEDGTIKGFTAIVGSDLYSTNWDGAIPADLSSGKDATATAGFYWDGSAGSAHLEGSLYVGGDIELVTGGAFRTAASASDRIEIIHAFAESSYLHVDWIAGGDAAPFFGIRGDMFTGEFAEIFMDGDGVNDGDLDIFSRNRLRLKQTEFQIVDRSNSTVLAEIDYGGGHPTWLVRGSILLDPDAGISGNMGLTIWNEHASGYGTIELGGKLGAYIDFKNAEADDNDVRFRLYGNDDFRFEGATWKFQGNVWPSADDTYSLGSASMGWANLYIGAGGWTYYGGSSSAIVGHDGSNFFVRNGQLGNLYLDSYVNSKALVMRAKTSGGVVRERLTIDGNGDHKFFWHNASALWQMTESAAYTPALYAHNESKHRLEFNWQNSSTWSWRMVINNSSKMTLQNAAAYIPEVYNQTTGTAANVNVATAGFLRRVSSTEEWKRNIEDWHNDGGYSVLDFVPVTFNPMESRDGDWTVLPDRILGLSFEQAQRVFPLAAVEYDKALDWNAITTGILYVSKDHEVRLQAIENRLTNCPHCGKLPQPTTHGDPHATE